MIKIKTIFILLLIFTNPLSLPAQESSAGAGRNFGQAAESIHQKLEQSIAELNQLRQQVAQEKVPLSRKLSSLENELLQLRQEYQQTSRLLDSRTLDLSNLQAEIRGRQDEAAYLSNLFNEYVRNFESRLHIAESRRYRQQLEDVKLAAENSSLEGQQITEIQAGLLEISLERLQDTLGGTRFDGIAVDASGQVNPGTFLLVGPAALFRSHDGQSIGTVQQRLGSFEPTVIAFGLESDTRAAEQLITTGAGHFPLDPTLGNAHKIEQTKETLLEHIKKGGPVMYPIFALAGAALLVALLKWFSMFLIRKPSQKRVRALLDAVAQHDEAAALQKAKAIGGPVGKMLTAGVEHIQEPPELIEEIMYEKVLATRLKLESFLPFIAICAASAPLLGLLGTVTGIINTFKLITVFGSGDVKTLSGGISEALITTEFGLIVAIPSLLIHAFLSRKARSVINHMEKAAVALVNQVSKTSSHPRTNSTGPTAPVREPVHSVRTHNSVLSPPPSSLQSEQLGKHSAHSLMDHRVVSVGKSATVAEAMDRIRSTDIPPQEHVDTVFIVDEKGKYVGYVLTRHLLSQPQQASVESVTETDPVFVRVDTHSQEVQNLFNQHDVPCLAVLDHEDQLVGRIKRFGNGNGR